VNKFEELLSLNVNEKTEKKGNLTYLSWSWAWSEFKKAYPDATYEVVKFDGLPYAYDEKTGYMVYTTVTADNLTHEMWLPVMDYKNKAMIDNATMFDVNKTIMRCLTKNLAMFGLGLYIYAGEDLPQKADAEIEKEKKERDEQRERDLKHVLKAIDDAPDINALKLVKTQLIGKTYKSFNNDGDVDRAEKLQNAYIEKKGIFNV
jgi:hypothetical protein